MSETPDAKTAIRQEALGKDFGPDTAEFDPTEGVAEDVAQEKRGILMRELESYERIVDGTRRAADGARHRAYRNKDTRDAWDALADQIDQGRRIAVRLSGYNRMEDGNASERVLTGEGLSLVEATTRINTGLKDAASGARQIANGQRMSFEWLRLAMVYEHIAKRARELARECTKLEVASHWGGQAWPQ
jgi:hypothetical protein